MMDRDNHLKRNINPRETTNFLSLITFFYTIKLYVKGYISGFDLDDIYEALSTSCAEKAGEVLEFHWHSQNEQYKSQSIIRAIWFSWNKPFLLFGILQFTTTMVATVWSPQALSKLISYFSLDQTQLSKNYAIIYGSTVVIIHLVHNMVKDNVRVLMTKISLGAKAAVSSMLYKKILKLSPESLSNVTTGKIVTLTSKDVDTLGTFFLNGNNIWIALIQTVVIWGLVYAKIGAASFSGICFFLILLPLQAFIGKMTYSYKLKCSKKTDERVDLIREVVTASKIIKMYTWEKFFETRIHTARKDEVRQLHKFFYTKVWITILGSICSKTTFFIFLMTYIWMGNNISAETAFYILICFNDLEVSLSNEIPFGFSQIADLFATAKRVESVLAAPELPPKEIAMRSTNPKITIRNATIKVHGVDIFKNCSMVVPTGLNVIRGPTGCGKTVLLKTILQEVKHSGMVQIDGIVSYASQEPWLFPSTIKNNILFGETYNKKRYSQVLQVCSLTYDLEQLPEGENTVVRESGINLSIGQQARINLARAIYKEGDIYLLDDCLASVDRCVSDQIFEDCVCKFLKKKLVILVTNNANYIGRAQRIVVVNSGTLHVIDQRGQEKVPIDDPTDDKSDAPSEEKINRQIYTEPKRSGRVPLKDYYRYVQNGGNIFVFLLILAMFVLGQITTSYSDKIFSEWITLEQNLTDIVELNETDSFHFHEIHTERTEKLILYNIMIATSLVLTLIKSLAFFYFTRKASINIHKEMVRNVINSTMKFLDSQFIGNIINRFTKDCVTLDDTLPFAARDCFMLLFTAFGGVILLTTVHYIFLLESIVLVIVTVTIKQLCQPTGRDLQRLHVISRSPINGHLHSTLTGLTTIRNSNNVQSLLLKEFNKHQDVFTSASFMVVTAYSALAFFLQVACTLFIAVIIFQFLLMDFGDTVGDVGLIVTQSFTITHIMASAILTVADAENLMVSVQRVLEYTELEQEDGDGQVLIDRPKLGSINFSKVSLNYGNLEKQVLSDVNFVINPAEKIGIVGRTGAGKSSIISSLFRLYPTNGKITIDGMDIRDVSLNWLRSNISILPQEPYLFSGTIRENLDPLKQYTDNDIWHVVNELQLGNLIDTLDLPVDKGSTFSAGQKQLLCLGRVLLRKNKILVLDEATANVDKETETLILEKVKRFANCTVINVSYKFLSIVNCNKVIVMSNGRVSEFDEVVKLLENENSLVHRMSK